MPKFDSTKLKTIAVFTSGGDAPGMNAAIRATVRASINRGLVAKGIISGFQGLLDSNFTDLSLRSMANVIQRGGTVLKTARCLDFLKPEFRKKASDILATNKIDGLICIGGDGSFNGCHLLWTEHQIPVVGIPGTIDNDIFGTEATVGFDTAVNTALSAIDKIRDTANSHDRIFIVEVMGRNTGFIAAHVGLAGGAEEVFTPDLPITVDQAIQKIKSAQSKGKTSSILVTAEGQKPGRAYDLAEQIRKKSGLDAKVCILGHQQRGGTPTAFDRILASRLGVFAVEQLCAGNSDIMVGIQNNSLVTVDLGKVTKSQKQTPKEFLNLISTLAH
jgi:6-phosphofructokinase 1